MVELEQKKVREHKEHIEEVKEDDIPKPEVAYKVMIVKEINAKDTSIKNNLEATTRLYLKEDDHEELLEDHLEHLKEDHDFKKDHLDPHKEHEY